MKEAYVSFEVAKLLKEKGFNEPCRSYFIDNVDYIDYFYSTEKLTDLHMGVWETLRPTQQMAMAWLREEKDVYIEIRRSLNTYLYGAIIAEGIVEKCRINNIYNSYEDAVEEAIKYSLENLI